MIERKNQRQMFVTLLFQNGACKNSGSYVELMEVESAVPRAAPPPTTRKVWDNSQNNKV